MYKGKNIVFSATETRWKYFTYSPYLTFKAFYEICKFYGLDVIKESIRKGAISNAVVKTATDPYVNTDFLVDRINTNLKRQEV